MRFKKSKPAERYLKVIQGNVQIAREELEEKGGLSPLCVLIKDRGVDGPLVNAVDLQGPDNSFSKEQSDQMLRAVAKKMNPDYAITIMEAAVLALPHHEAYRQGLREGKWKDLTECPLCENVVLFYLETRNGLWVGKSGLIEKDGKKTFSEVVFEETKISGRFANVLTTKVAK